MSKTLSLQSFLSDTLAKPVNLKKEETYQLHMPQIVERTHFS